MTKKWVKRLVPDFLNFGLEFFNWIHPTARFLFGNSYKTTSYKGNGWVRGLRIFGTIACEEYVFRSQLQFLTLEKVNGDGFTARDGFVEVVPRSATREPKVYTKPRFQHNLSKSPPFCWLWLSIQIKLWPLFKLKMAQVIRRLSIFLHYSIRLYNFEALCALVPLNLRT